jgi:hypothetical protein
VADLDRSLEGERAAAFRTGVAFARLPDVGETRLVVATRRDAAEVPAGPVRARDELAFAQRLVRDDLAREPDRAERAALGAEPGLDLVVGGRPEVAPEGGRELCRLQAVVAAQEPEHEASVVRHHRHRLRRRGEIDREQLRERFAGARVRRLDLLGCPHALGEVRRPRYALRDLEIGCVVAVLAGDEGVLAGAGRREIVDRLAAAHHPRLGLDGTGLETAALEDAVVGALVRLEAAVEAGLVAIERVGVLHDELPHAQ